MRNKMADKHVFLSSKKEIMSCETLPDVMVKFNILIGSYALINGHMFSSNKQLILATQNGGIKVSLITFEHQGKKLFQFP